MIIHIPPIHRHLTNDTPTFTTEGATVGECFDQLVMQYPQIKTEIFDEKGDLQTIIGVFLNTKNAFPGELERKVSDGDVIFITTVLAGG